MPRNHKVNLQLTPEINARFTTFVKKYVSDRQEEAAELLSMSQSTISNIYLGKRPPSPKVWNVLITKYNLNQDWLINGKGNPIRHQTEDKKTLLQDIGALQNEIVKLEKKMQIYEANQNHLFKVVEGLQENLRELQRR